jgi:hypothetical protein
MGAAPIARQDLLPKYCSADTVRVSVLKKDPNYVYLPIIYGILDF